MRPGGGVQGLREVHTSTVRRSAGAQWSHGVHASTGAALDQCVGGAQRCGCGGAGVGEEWITP